MNINKYIFHQYNKVYTSLFIVNGHIMITPGIDSMHTRNSITNVYCMGTLTRHSWIHYTDCWIVK